MILTTTSSIEGRPVAEYLGVVASETIAGANVVRDLFASFTDFFGGRSRTYEWKMAEARETALREMEQKARAMGADAVIGIDLDYETIGQMLMVSASGTAVILAR